MTKNYLRILLLIVGLCHCSFATATPGHFFDVGPFTRVAADGRTVVVALMGENGASGLLFFYLDTPHSPQEIDPLLIEAGAARSFFMRFDERQNSYTEILLPGGDRYNIRPGGGFSVVLSSDDAEKSWARISISNSTHSPYCSIIVADHDDSQLSILGFVGLQEVLRLSQDPQTIELLEANQILQTEDFLGLVSEFRLDAFGKIQLKGKAFRGRALGISSAETNPCLEQGATILDQGASRIGAKSEDLSSSQLMKAYVTDQSLSRQLDEFLLTSVSRKFIGALDYKSGRIGLIRKIGEINTGKVCAFFSIDED